MTLIFSMWICSLDPDCELTYTCKHTACISGARPLVLSILLASLIRLRASALLLLTAVPCSAAGMGLRGPGVPGSGWSGFPTCLPAHLGLLSVDSAQWSDEVEDGPHGDRQGWEGALCTGAGVLPEPWTPQEHGLSRPPGTDLLSGNCGTQEILFGKA